MPLSGFYAEFQGHLPCPRTDAEEANVSARKSESVKDIMTPDEKAHIEAAAGTLTATWMRLRALPSDQRVITSSERSLSNSTPGVQVIPGSDSASVAGPNADGEVAMFEELEHFDGEGSER